LLKTKLLGLLFELNTSKSMHWLATATVLTMLAAGLAGASHAQSEETVVVLSTNSGKIAIELFPQDAPGHVDNFVQLSSDGFYTGTLFHRIIPGFMIQGGDPLTRDGESTAARWGTGGPEHRVPQEFNDIKHLRGIVSMARSADPDSAGSQFFVVHADSTFLDGQYTVFGRIVTQESFETLDRIASLSTTDTKPDDWEQARITSVDVLSRSDIDGILDLGAPARLAGSAAMPDDPLYQNSELGIEFQAPVGWLIQEPPKTHQSVPDIVMVNDGSGTPNPAISVTVLGSGGKDLAQIVDEKKEAIRPAIESGQLTIVDEGSVGIYGKDIYAINALGTHPSEDGAVPVQFTEITFLEGDRLYLITYAAAPSEYEAHYDDLVGVVESFAVTDPDPPGPGTGTEPAAELGGCLIATAAFGSEMAPQVQLLREVRDGTVLNTLSGSSFMAGFNQIYYSFSPTVADWERQSPAFREAVRIAITPMLATLGVLNHVEIDSEHEMIVYGLGVIAMNVGMYVAAPAIAAHRILRR